LNLFRRMAWIGGDEFDPSQALSGIEASLSERSKAYGMLWASMVDVSFKRK
jgi:hypothetical protein